MSGQGFCRMCSGYIQVEKMYFEEEDWRNQQSSVGLVAVMWASGTAPDSHCCCCPAHTESSSFVAASGVQVLAFARAAWVVPLAARVPSTCAP